MQTSIITFDGKLDTLVGFKNNSGGYSLRKRIKPRNPNTYAQRDVRAKFTAVSRLEQTMRPQLFGLVPAAKQDKITVRNEFIKVNFSGCETVGIQDDELVVSLSYQNLVVAKGSGRQVLNPQFQTDIPGTIIFTYDANSQGNEDLDDPIHLIGLIGNMDRVFHAQAKRRDGQLALENLPADTSGETMYLYYFTQHFSTASAKASYDAAVLANQADGYAFLAESAANSIFSDSKYGAKVTLA